MKISGYIPRFELVLSNEEIDYALNEIINDIGIDKYIPKAEPLWDSKLFKVVRWEVKKNVVRFTVEISKINLQKLGKFKPKKVYIIKESGYDDLKIVVAFKQGAIKDGRGFIAPKESRYSNIFYDFARTFGLNIAKKIISIVKSLDDKKFELDNYLAFHA